ncbi:hypothetical protein ABZ468_35210 [Streptomyces sp. NPDC005708]|uniref:hypothetical protein n=1 Tax=Streptomyces sp. NPDC005708 TaxID=3154564 RepID=UPI0033E29EB7
MPSLTSPTANIIDAINRGDSDDFLRPFVGDAIVNDRHNVHRGHDEIRAWYETEIAGKKVTIDVTDVRIHYGDEIVTGLVGNIPDHDRLALYFSLRNDTVVQLVVLPIAGHPVES